MLEINLKIEDDGCPSLWCHDVGGPCERCDHMVWGQAIDKVHRHMGLYELFGQSISPSYKKNVAEKEQWS